MALAGGLALPGAVRAQAPVRSSAVVAGAEFRRFKIGDDSTGATVRQSVVPFGAVATLGRFVVDIGGGYASSTLSLGPRGERTLSGLTDTQVRGSLTLGRDLAVVTVMLNLPTGLDRLTLADFPVLGAISSSFLALPVNAYGSGFSATSGLALALPAGAWNVGLAGSVRVSSRYTPFDDPTGVLSYRPGVEGRIRVGVDRSIGRSRIEGGFTYSTFGTDQYSSGTAAEGLYQPGPRWIGEASVTAPVGRRALLTLSGWHFQRSQGDTVGVVVANAEKLTAGDAILRIDQGPRVSVQLGLGARWTSQGPATGWMGGGEVGLGLELGGGLTLSPAARIDTGRLEVSGVGQSIKGIGGSVFLRKSF